MNSSKITVYAALGRKKILEKRIQQLTNLSTLRNTSLVGTDLVLNCKRNEKGEPSEGVAAFEKRSKAYLDEFESLSKELVSLANAIQKSNLEQTIRISGKDYTVFEAVMIRKQLENQRALYNTIKNQVAVAEQVVEDSKQKAEDMIANIPANMAKDVRDLEIMRINGSQLREVIAGFDYRKYLDEQGQLIIAFDEELNVAITTSNVGTIITYEW